MKNYLKILSAPFTLALGILLGYAITPVGSADRGIAVNNRQIEKTAKGWFPGSADPPPAWFDPKGGQTPCLKNYPNGLQLCTDNKIVQEVWTFPAQSWDGAPLPIGSAIGLQMTRIPTGPGAYYQTMQFIFSAPGSGGGVARFGPLLTVDPAFWLQLKSGLNAQ